MWNSETNVKERLEECSLRFRNTCGTSVCCGDAALNARNCLSALFTGRLLHVQFWMAEGVCVRACVCTRVHRTRSWSSPSEGRDKQQTDMSAYEECSLESEGGDGLRTACWFG